MIGPGFIDEMDLDLCGDFFDHIDDLLDFPCEEIEGNGGVIGGGDCNAFQDMWPSIPPPESLVDPCSGFSNSSSDLSTELPVPHEDIVQLEWLSNFVEDSFSAGSIPLDTDFINNNKKDESHRFRTSSPVSVLESNSSCSGGKTMSLSPDTVVPGRARSKRPRPATFNPRPALNFVSPVSSITNVQNLSVSNSYLSSESENYAESHPPYIPNYDGTEQKKKKKKKKLTPSLPSYSSDLDDSLQQQQQQQPGVAVRKCLHCEITKTPQWRAGPMGPKTLCNACGVRYKSGRLFPEYRPAASPTFVASLHSNSHKKVLEMRVKGTPDDMNPMSPAPEFLPASNTHMLDYI
ncbi:GATA transcription factor 8-like isoform X2 [Papaver somniferum]|nr:GATA transcription factor 8-like isoform X2 [Papaver somniferum]XP_026425161.1 GATA transcription factor 8-like isoform X2 [Papaver somniferum]XP_026425162.1 GATA transcription factor 8-like isoform X2 [Papaver somniferum]